MTQHNDDGDRSRIIDIFGAVEVGKGYALAWCINPDGSAWPLLQDERVTAPQRLPASRAEFAKLAPHELLGQLPERFQLLHCGALTRSGTPCRVRVRTATARCRHHVEVAPTPRSTHAQMALFELEHGADT